MKSGLLETYERIEHWLKHSRRGDKLVYYVGHLAQAARYQTRAYEAIEIARVRDLMREAQDNAKVRLFQRRGKNGKEFEYLAIKR